MPKPEPIATREYAVRLSGGRKRRVFVDVFAPEPFGDFVCRLVITGLGKTPIRAEMRGIDGVQSLSLALTQAGRLLLESRAFKDGRLEDEWGHPVEAWSLGLPMQLAAVESAVLQLREVLKVLKRTELPPKALAALAAWPEMFMLGLGEIAEGLRTLAPVVGATVEVKTSRRASPSTKRMKP